MTKKAVFFIRRYNDIDHIVPVIYKLATTRDIDISIIMRAPEDYLEDYRIQLVKKLSNIKIFHINDFYISYLFKRKRINIRYNARKKYNPARIIEKILISFIKYLNNIFKIFKKNTFSEKLIHYFFNDIKKGVIIFDWQIRSKEKKLFMRQIVEESKKIGVHCLSLPHGDCPFYNKMFPKNTLNYVTADNFGNDPSDVVVVPNKMCAERYICHKGKQNVKVLGSPRYNKEWLKILNTLIPEYRNERSSRKVKIVAFLRNRDCPVFWEEVDKTIKLITQFPEIYLIVKHHITGGFFKRVKNIYPELTEMKSNLKPNLEFAYENIQSESLIKWADVILDLGTSIVNEAIRFGKPVLAMDYLHANISTSAFYLKNTRMNCRDELYDELKVLIKNPRHRRYTEKERKRFVNEMIDCPDENVLERYVDLIDETINL